MANITTCSACANAYEAGSEEQANEPGQLCPACVLTAFAGLERDLHPERVDADLAESRDIYADLGEPERPPANVIGVQLPSYFRPLDVWLEGIPPGVDVEVVRDDDGTPREVRFVNRGTTPAEFRGTVIGFMERTQRAVSDDSDDDDDSDDRTAEERRGRCVCGHARHEHDPECTVYKHGKDCGCTGFTPLVTRERVDMQRWTCILCGEQEVVADGMPRGWSSVINYDVCASCIDHLDETRAQGHDDDDD